MYYSVKLKWLEPKEGTDEMKRTSKQFLVNALSVTEAEMRVVEWTPANYQDAVVEAVTKTAIDEINIKGACETFWSVKWLDDMDGTQAKAIAVTAVLNANSAKEAIIRAEESPSFGDIEEVKKYKVIVDEDLISEKITRKLTPIDEEITS